LDALALVAEADGPPAAVQTVGLARRRRSQTAGHELDALALALEAVVRHPPCRQSALLVGCTRTAAVPLLPVWIASPP
jgi:hypothetical protein